MARELKGIIPPMTTPFTRTGEVYEEGLRRLVEFLVDKGCHGLFICGSYGSGPLMTLAERKKVSEIVVEQARGRIAVVTHVGSATTADAVELAKHAADAGADYVASISPFYYHYDEKSVAEYFRALAQAVNVPVYVYNNPKAVNVSITPRLLRRLADVGVAGIKDSGFNYIDFTHLVLAMEDRPDFRFIVGTEAIALPAFMVGAKGCVSGLANAFPEIMVQLWNLYEAGKYEEASRLQLKVNKARQALHIPSSTNAACYAALNARGVDVGYPRPPILPVEEKDQEAMMAAFRQMGLV